MEAQDVIPLFWVFWFVTSPYIFINIQLTYEEFLRQIITDLSYLLLAFWVYKRYFSNK